MSYINPIQPSASFVIRFYSLTCYLPCLKINDLVFLIASCATCGMRAGSTTTLYIEWDCLYLEQRKYILTIAAFRLGRWPSPMWGCNTRCRRFSRPWHPQKGLVRMLISVLVKLTARSTAHCKRTGTVFLLSIPVWLLSMRVLRSYYSKIRGQLYVSLSAILGYTVGDCRIIPALHAHLLKSIPTSIIDRHGCSMLSVLISQMGGDAWRLKLGASLGACSGRLPRGDIRMLRFVSF